MNSPSCNFCSRVNLGAGPSSSETRIEGVSCKRVSAASCRSSYCLLIFVARCAACLIEDEYVLLSNRVTILSIFRVIIIVLK